MTENSEKPTFPNPGVINNEKLNKFLAKDEELDMVQIVRLDFHGILKIDHLWMLKSLTKLSLTHNQILIIENLEELVNLKELDLSFNQISKIENLHTLINIEMLILNNNRITILENIENLKMLRVFCISENLIYHYQEFTYLRKIKSLRSLSYKNNPCCDEIQCDSFVKAVLPKIVYMNYILVTPEEKKECSAMYKKVIQKLEEEEEFVENELLNQQKIDAENELHYHSFVEYLKEYELFETMFEYDKKMYDYMLIFVHRYEELMEFKDYKAFYIETMKEFVQYGIEQYNVREKEIQQFKDVMDTARSNCAEKSRKMIKTFLSEQDEHLKKILTITTEEIDMSEKNQNITKICDTITNLIETLWKNLMLEEMTLYEQCEDTKNHFYKNIEELCLQILNTGQVTFNSWREREMEWQVQLEGPMMTVIKNQMHKKNDCEEMQKKIAINHMQLINDREELLIARVRKWSSEIIYNTSSDEIRRNRKRILEITCLIQKYKLHLKNIQNFVENDSYVDLNIFLKNTD